ncbi:MAG: glycosyltransferase family 4 protein [Candidatus Sericytochromatia bacterium]|nr:glycosyltransferase family 4 protein [Candidatus Sericytochromatia bacterium]
MRIALIAPIALPVPPPEYGGTERVVALLARGLQRLGHDVVLFAAAGSDPQLPLAQLSDAVAEQPALPYARAEAAHVRQAYRMAADCDIVHDHTKQRGLQLARFCPVPVVSTLHNPVTPARHSAYQAVPDHPWVAISHAQARQVPGLRLAGVVHHGIDVDSADGSDTKDDYLLFLGRISPDKGVHHAIAVARASGRPLIIAGPVAAGSEGYFQQAVAPAIDGRRIRHVGSVGGTLKRDLLRRAAALLFPIVWDEPFGLVVLEALACGTPVLALRRGAVPEILTDHRVGRAVPTPADMIAALPDVLRCRPEACREHVRRHFGVEQMARGYEAIYRGLLVAAGRDVPGL